MSKPASAPRTAEPTKLLEYVPELLGEMDRVKVEEDAARAELKRIDAKVAETEIALYARRAELRRPDRSGVLAGAALRGEPPPPEPKDPPGADPKDLEATIKGLQAMREEPKQRIAEARASMRALALRAFLQAVERAVPDYIWHARCLEALHAEIGTAQAVANSIGGGENMSLVFLGPDWWNLCIPSTDRLAAMQSETRTLYSRQVLAGGDKGEWAQKAAAAGLSRDRAEMTRRFGYWPLDQER